MSMLRSLASRLPKATLARPSLTSASIHQISPLNRQIFSGLSRHISTSSVLSQATATASASHASDAHEEKEDKKDDKKEHHHRGRPRKHEADKAEEEPSTMTEYVNRYGGWYPLLGLGAVIALSKELLVLNEEFLMVSNFAAFVFISWMAVGDTVNDMVRDKAEAIRKNHDDVSDLYIESLEAVIQAGENSLATLPLMKQLKGEYGSLGEQVVKAKELKARAAARDAVMARLQQVYQKEQNEKAKYLAAVYDNAYQQVQERLGSLSEQEKARMIDSAIAMIGGGAEEQDDPVSRIYQEVLSSTRQQQQQQPGQGAQRSSAGQGAKQNA